ncbi:30S ribosomal protein S13 [Microgenomates group bacterium]|nr:30S ribosomal protein S13 [Microgenomates group bacterium]
MLRISGVDIPEQKKLSFALQAIYGVGPKIAKDIITSLRLDPTKRAHELTNEEISKISAALDKIITEGDLRRQISDNIDRLRRIKSYRGMRHSMGLPVRGQRTRTNSRTVRGNKRHTIGSMTKEMAAKLEAAKSSK